MGGIGSSIIYTAIGKYYMTTNDGTIIKIPMYYSSDTTETIVSTHDIYNSHRFYTIFTKEFDTETREGTLTF